MVLVAESVAAAVSSDRLAGPNVADARGRALVMGDDNLDSSTSAIIAGMTTEVAGFIACDCAPAH